MKRRPTKALLVAMAVASPVGLGVAAISAGEGGRPPVVAASPGDTPSSIGNAPAGTPSSAPASSAPARPSEEPPADDTKDATAGDGAALGVQQPDQTGRRPYGGSPEKESALVAQEDQRLTQVRSFAAGARWSKQPMVFPYQVVSGNQRTLVLTERKAPYTAAELLKLTPEHFIQVQPNLYYLSENVVVMPGATLHLGGNQATTVWLASDANGFASIVNDGGRLEIAGTANAPVTVTSWDLKAQAADQRTDDGRAYIRSQGGQVDLEAASFEALGFWSGRTGGVAVVGGDDSQVGSGTQTTQGVDLSKASADAAAKQQAAQVDSAAAAAEAAKVAQAAAQAKAAGQAPGPAKSQARQEARQDAAALPGTVAVDKVQPAGEVVLAQPSTSGSTSAAPPPAATPAAVVKGVTVTDGAYGLFVSGVADLTLADSTVRGSRVDGVVLHRNVTRANLSGVRAEESRGDGLVVSRAATQVKMANVAAVGNGRDGILVSGAPLAEGPNAAGSSTTAHGDTSVTSSTVKDNGRYGVAVVGGRHVDVTNNQVQGQQVGIVVRTAAENVNVTGNHVEGADKQGIAVRDGAKSTLVQHNEVADAPTGVYVRESGVSVQDNTVQGATSHAMTVVGNAQDVTLQSNTVSGEGPTAFDVARADGLDAARVQADNRAEDWSVAKPLVVASRRVLAPLTVLWLGLAGVVVATGIRARGRRWEKRHPYADKAPVSGPESLVAAPRPQTAARPALDGS